MTSFTFTSEDLKKVNAEKTTEEQIFPRAENVRVAQGLMQEDGVKPDLNLVEEAFMIDATRSTPVVLKNGQHSKAVLQIDNTGSDKPILEPLVRERVNSLKQEGLSEQQVNDFKFMSNQANIGSIAGELVKYFAQKDIFQDAEKRATNIQHVGGTLAQLEITTEAEPRLIYRTGTRITFDKNKTHCHYSGYGMCASYEIASKDNIIITAEVDLGPLGAKNYTPKVACSIHAEGNIAEGVLEQIKHDISQTLNPKAKSSAEIKTQYEEIVAKTLQLTGYEEQFKTTIKNDIELLFSQGKIEANFYSNKSKLGAIKEFKSTPKLFAEVLVDKIDEALKNPTPEGRKDAIQALSKNASQLIDQPRGYMNILINDIARDRATKAGQELPKEKFIQRVKDKLNLIFAKFQSKTASQNIKIIREANKARSQGHSK